MERCLAIGALVAASLAVAQAGAAPPIAVDVAAGGGHTCAVLDTGRVRCWGAEGETQQPASTTAFEVPGITDATSVVASRAFTCVAHARGRVSCWGPGKSAHPQDLSEKDVVELALADDYLCMRRSTGRVACWWIGERARRGIALSGATQMALGGPEQGCVLRKDGTVACWGGWSLRGKELQGEGFRPVPGITGAREIAGSGDTICARLAGGIVRCWEGRQGVYRPDGLAAASRVLVVHGVPCVQRRGAPTLCQRTSLGEEDDPSPVVIDARLDGLRRVSSGLRHVCGIRSDGQVVCWGANDRGQLGYPTARASRTPVEVAGLDDAVAIEAGPRHTCALRRKGEVSCWGQGTEARRLPFHTRPKPLAAVTVAKLTPGGFGGLTTDGLPVSLMGGARAPSQGPIAESVNGWDRLRDGRVVSFQQQPPVRELDSVAGVIQMSAGALGLCLVFADGRLGCHGYEFSGLTRQECSAPPGMHVHCRRAPPPRQPVILLSGVSQASVGAEQVCAVLRTGQVTCRSKNLRDQPPGQVRFQIVAGLDRARLVKVNERYTVCAVREDGAVLCWGSDLAADDEFAWRKDGGIRHPGLVAGLSDAIDVALGHRHACALRRNGHVACWGNNEIGQLGNGTSGTALYAGVAQALHGTPGPAR